MLRSTSFVACLLAGASPVWAGETPLYQSAPAWVKAAPSPDPAHLPTPRPQVLMFDQQQRIEDGRLSTYVRSANIIANPAMLNQAGTVTVDWQPDHGDVVVHHVRLLREGETIDLLAKGERFEVMKRELGMEQRMLTGVLTAAMEIQGARVGDILDVAYTITSKDPVLKGNVTAFMPLMAKPVSAGLARNRISWAKSDDIRLRTYMDGVALDPKLVGDHYEVEVAGPVPKPVDMPIDAPLRFRPFPIVEASSFTDWAGVSRTFAPLYATTGLIAPSSPLATEVERIRKAAASPRERTALALQSVQAQVRYLFKGMAGGNYTPQAPAQTWSARYGDCKAKTLLLLAMLHALEIEAEPVLANIEGGDYLPRRLPGAGAFDHVLVHATINGQDLWLDGTGQGARLADLDNTPPFRWVLPLRADGATLTPVPMRPHVQPDTTAVLDIDQRGGVALPTTFKLSVAMRGQVAEMMRLVKSSGTREQLVQLANQMTSNFINGSRVVAHDIGFDDVASMATLTTEGFAQPGWNFANGRKRRDIDFTVGNADFAPDRSRTAWKAVPVMTPPPETSVVRIRLHLPDGGKGYTIEGARALPKSVGGVEFTRRVTFEKGLLELEDRITTTGGEIAPDRVAAERAAMAALKARPLQLVAPADLPDRHVERAAALRDGRVKPLLAMYDRAVADAEADDPTAWDSRYSLRMAMSDYAGALADLDKAIAIEGGAQRLANRYHLLRVLKRDADALTAAQAAFDADSSIDYATLYADALSEAAKYDEALALLDERIGAGGDDGRRALAMRADVLGRMGNAPDAVAALDKAIAEKPNDPGLYNNRCWTRATLNVDLDAALADCDRAIAMGIGPAALDSRALVHFRAGRLDRARADLDEALSAAPEMAAALYLRGIVRQRQGDVEGGKADISTARASSPRIEESYHRWRVTA